MTDSSATVRHRDKVDSSERDTKILELVDVTIGKISGRDLVSTSEMTDLLLDIRLHLMLEAETEVV